MKNERRDNISYEPQDRRIGVFLCAVLGLFFLATVVWAEGDVFDHPLRPDTRAAFEMTSARLSEHSIVKGNFEQEKILSRLGRSLRSSGDFIIASELGMVWDTIRPFPSTLVLGRDYFVQSRPGGQRTVLSAAGNETFLGMADVISAVFSGNIRRLLENFEVFYSGSPSAWELGLLPSNRAIAAFAGRVVMKGDVSIKSIVVNEHNGDSIVYILSNQSFPPELTIHERAFFQ